MQQSGLKAVNTRY